MRKMKRETPMSRVVSSRDGTVTGERRHGDNLGQIQTILKVRGPKGSLSAVSYFVDTIAEHYS